MNLAQHSATVMSRDPPTPLHPLFKMAILNGVKSSVQVFVSRGHEVNAKDQAGRSPLILAASRGHEEICRLLLDAGADPSLCDNEGENALSAAEESGWSSIRDLLASYMTPTAPMHQEAIENWISDKPSINPVANQEDSYETVSVPLSDHSYGTSNTGEFGETRFNTDHSDDNTTLLSPDTGDSEYDLSAWIEETETPPPPDDPKSVDDAGLIQQAISLHDPIDTDEDWSDIEISLPTLFETWRGRRTFQEDKERTTAVRSLLLAGLVNGCVSSSQIAGITTIDDDDAPLFDRDLDNNLRIALGEINVFVDDESDLNDTPESSVEEFDDRFDELANEVLAFLMNLDSQAGDPLTCYLKDIGASKVLTRDQEVTLARDIEEGMKEALSAIAQCPEAMCEVLSMSERILRGDMSIHAMVSGDPRSSGNHESLGLEEPGERNNGWDMDDAENDSEKEILPENKAPMDFMSRIAVIREVHLQLTETNSQSVMASLVARLRKDLNSLRLSDGFLQHLRETVPTNLSGRVFHRRMDSGLSRAWQAKRKFVEANLRLVLLFANKYSNLTLMDRIQEGNLGLLKAIDRFDYKRARFSTYAGWWIRQSITRAIADTSQTIRIPVHMVVCINRVRKFRDHQIALTGHSPGLEEIAEGLSLDARRVLKALMILEGHASAGSLDDVVYLDDYPFPDTKITSPEEAALSLSVHRAVRQCLDCLSPRQAKVIRLRFGFDGYKECTLEEIGQQWGMTRERVRQIESKALARLKHPTRSKRLRELL